MDVVCSFDSNRIQRDRVYGWLRGSYWSPNIRRDVFELALANSLVIGAYAEDGTQVGYTRVVTDYATFAWVCDVFVDPGSRGQGISKRMFAELHAHPQMQTIRRWALATADAQGLYSQLEYVFVPDGRWMHRVMPPAAWQEAGE